jgi:hypothetical protein
MRPSIAVGLASVVERQRCMSPIALTSPSSSAPDRARKRARRRVPAKTASTTVWHGARRVASSRPSPVAMGAEGGTLLLIVRRAPCALQWRSGAGCSLRSATAVGRRPLLSVVAGCRAAASSGSGVCGAHRPSPPPSSSSSSDRASERAGETTRTRATASSERTASSSNALRSARDYPLALLACSRGRDAVEPTA